MTRRMRLSDRSVSRLRAERTEYTVWDTRVADLGVRVRPSGYRTFVCLEQREGTSRRHTLGPVNLMSVDEARARCRDRQIDKDTGMEQTDNFNPVPLFRHFVVQCLEDGMPCPVQAFVSSRHRSHAHAPASAGIRRSTTGSHRTHSGEPLVRQLQHDGTRRSQHGPRPAASDHESRHGSRPNPDQSRQCYSTKSGDAG